MEAMATTSSFVVLLNQTKRAAAAAAFGPSLVRFRGVRSRPNIAIANQKTRAMKESNRDDASSGEEPPESLFLKELKRRGLSPTSTSTETKTKDEEGTEAEGRSQQPVQSSRDWTKQQKDQLERSRALSSEGLDGLIPRAQELLKLGATFFLAFWPLILAIVAVFIVIYLYFGATFIHEGNEGVGLPPYVDPFQLLEEESQDSYMLTERRS